MVYTFGFLKKEYKYMLFEGFIATCKSTVFDTYEEARKSATFKSSIYKVPEDLVDTIKRKRPIDGAIFCGDHRKCELVFIGTYDEFFRPGAWM